MILDVQNSCKVDTESPHILFTQLPLTLAFSTFLKEFFSLNFKYFTFE